MDFLLYAASLEASVATRSNISIIELDRSKIQSTLNHTIDEGVQDGHGPVGDTGIRVDLLQHYGTRQ